MLSKSTDHKIKRARAKREIADHGPQPPAGDTCWNSDSPAVDPDFLLLQEGVPLIALVASLAVMNSPPRKARKITQATLAFQLTPKCSKTPGKGSPELATHPKGCISPSPSTSNPSALASTPVPSTEVDDDDDEEEEIDTRNTVLASTRCTFTVPLHRPELSGYRRCFRSNRRLGGNKISWIYLHGVELEKRGPSGKWIKHWICRYCHEQGRIKVMNAQASTNCTRHLNDQHGIGLERLEESVQAQGRIEGFMDEHLWEERWREDYVNWIAKDDITLSQATSPHLQRLLARSGPKVTNLLPQRSSARRWLMDAYEQRKPEVAESLHTSLSDVSLSFDGWSSPNGLSLLGVVAHWIDKDCTLRNALIGMPRLEGQHSGEKIAEAVSALIRDYGIQRKIGAFVLDNAANNDTAVEILAQEFGLDPAQCRLRC